MLIDVENASPTYSPENDSTMPPSMNIPINASMKALTADTIGASTGFPPMVRGTTQE